MRCIEIRQQFVFVTDQFIAVCGRVKRTTFDNAIQDSTAATTASIFDFGNLSCGKMHFRQPTTFTNIYTAIALL